MVPTVLFRNPHPSPRHSRCTAIQRGIRCLALIVAAATGTAAAEDADNAGNALAPIHVTSSSASGNAVERASAPASVSVITAEELAGKSYRDISQALRTLPGVYVDSGPSGRLGTGEISIRGMDSRYTEILVDGRPRGSQQGYYNGYGSGAEYGWLPPMSAIERIEVIRGPMSSLYGSGSLGGVINVITKDTAQHWSGSVSLDRVVQADPESGDRTSSDFYISGPLAGETLSATVYGSTMTRDEDEFAEGYPELDRDSATARFDWTPNDANHVQVEAGYSSQDNRDTLANAGNDARFHARRRHQAVSHKLEWGDGLRTRTYVEHAERDMSQPGGASRYSSTYEQTTVDTSTSMPLGAHVLTAGARYRTQETRHSAARAYNKAGLERWDAAVFAEDEWFMTDAFTLTTGARLVDDEKYGTEWVPRMYGVYSLNRQWTLKGGASAAYRTPNLKEGDSDWVEGGGGPGTDGADIGNSDLKPEESVTYELAAIWQGRSGTRAGITVYRTNFDNKISKPTICDTGAAYGCSYQGTAYQQIAQYQNVDEARVNGLELELGTFLGAADISMNYTFTDSEQETGEAAGYPLNNQPRHQANVSIDWQTTAALNLWGNARYRGEAEQTPGRRGLSEAYPAYTLVDLGARYRLNERVRIHGGVMNLFDKEIDPEDYGRVLDGRRYNVGMVVDF